MPGVPIATELKLLVDSGLSPSQALAAATSDPAEYYGLARIGWIEAGYPADFIVLADNALESIEALENPVGVFTRRVWHDAKALAVFAEQARRAARGDY